ncbi:MAG: hypothetical protein A2138_00410 [Deltaproteobacteria bacterium RBG_16_71_12]|nr:MAG: hypothetical protein A2138_00410 [Deltaproteobacteria bacterium RBG_16_71_12]
MTRAIPRFVLFVAGAALVAPTARGQEGGMDFGGAEEGSDTPPPAEAPAAEAPGAETPAAAAAPDVNLSALDEGINLTLQDRIKAVSRKVFLKANRFELFPSLGVTTNDPFYRTWSIDGRAAWHINDALAVEVGGAYVPPFFIEKLPTVDLLREQAQLINADSKLLGRADAGITFSPIYGKVAILSDAIIHFDAFAVAGGGAVFDTNFSDVDPLNFVHPAMDVGAGMRVFLLRWFVVRADLRDYVYPQDRRGISTLQNLLTLNLGVGFYLPPDFDYQYEAAKVRK